MTPVVAAIVARLAESGGERLGLSRASWLRGIQWDTAVTEAPVVGGQTVWTALQPPASVLVVEQPNWFGRLEHAVPTAAGAITIHWWNEIRPSAGAVVSPYPVGTLAAARNLAGRLRQIPGVGLPHGQPETPWFIATLPKDATVIELQLRAAGFTRCKPLGKRYPEFPGGLRIQVAWTKEANEAFAMLLVAALGV